jgi:hypothetical protein
LLLLLRCAQGGDRVLSFWLLLMLSLSPSLSLVLMLMLSLMLMLFCSLSMTRVLSCSARQYCKREQVLLSSAMVQ